MAKIIVSTSNNNPVAKQYQKEVHLINIIEVKFLMVLAGTITSLSSSGLTTIQYKINAGSYATPSFPLAYAANDVITFTYAYTDLTALTGNLILIGKDN